MFSVFFRWYKKRPGVHARIVTPLRRRDFSFLGFSPPIIVEQTMNEKRFKVSLCSSMSIWAQSSLVGLKMMQ